MPTWLIIVLIIVLFILVWFMSTYNSLVALRNKVKDQKAQIDVTLKRRFDLIPNLVETVKGYAKHEKDTLEEVVKARNTYTSATTTEDQLKADSELQKGITKLFALAEQYPDLKANENFINLQNQLTETEDKIQYSRQFYNDEVMKYNNKIEMFPSNIIANLFHFVAEKFFEANEEERQNVKVKF